MVRIRVDLENNSEVWWAAARASKAPAAEVDEPTAWSILAWASALPGWDEPTAPAFAPHPLVSE